MLLPRSPGPELRVSQPPPLPKVLRLHLQGWGHKATWLLSPMARGAGCLRHGRLLQPMGPQLPPHVHGVTLGRPLAARSLGFLLSEMGTMVT